MADYEDHILSLSPIAYWRLDETSGTDCIDISGNGHDGLYGGTYTLGETTLQQRGTNPCVLFDGSTGFVNFSFTDPLLVIPASPTISFTAIIDSDSFSGYRTIFADCDGSGTASTTRLVVCTNGSNWYFSLGDGTASSTLGTTAHGMSTGTTYHIVVTINGTTLKAYIDGTLSTTWTSGVALGTVGTIAPSIGRFGQYSAHYFSGHIDEVAVFPTELIQSEVTALYNKYNASTIDFIVTTPSGGMDNSSINSPSTATIKLNDVVQTFTAHDPVQDDVLVTYTGEGNGYLAYNYTTSGGLEHWVIFPSTGGYSIGGTATSFRTTDLAATDTTTMTNAVGFALILDAIDAAFNLIPEALFNSTIYKQFVSAGTNLLDKAFITLFFAVADIINNVDEATRKGLINLTVNQLFGTGTAAINRGELACRAATALAFQSLATRGFKFSPNDELTFTYAIRVISKQIMQILDTLETSTAVTPAYSLGFIVPDNIEYADTSTLQAELAFAVEEGLVFLAERRNYNTATYVMNSLTKGISEYHNYDFNSYSNGYLCKEDGLYKLEGTTDTGTAIDWSLKTGSLDFGEPYEKQVPYCYIGVASDNTIVLKTVTDYRGTKQETWYRGIHTNGSVDNTRIQLGKGVKSRYWQFVLLGEGEVEIDSVELIPLVLKRMI
jgi:hypothetical protein